jgi:hypothetical protein
MRSIYKTTKPLTLFDSNKSTNKMQQFHKFITRHLCVARHVSSASPSIIRSIQPHYQPLILLLESGVSSVAGHGVAGYQPARP